MCRRIGFPFRVGDVDAWQPKLGLGHPFVWAEG